MADWKVTSPIDYSPNGDDVDRFAQKSIATFEEIFEHLNDLRRHGAKAGLDESNTSPYEIRIDTTTDTIYMRDAANKKWYRLGSVAEFFGLTAKDIGAVENGGGMERLFLGNDADKPTDAKTHDFYFAVDTRKLYVYEGSDWHILLSREFSDMLNYEDYIVPKSEVSVKGAGKILRLDPETGKGDIDITGSADHMLGKEINVTALHDKDVLMWNEEKQAFTAEPKDVFTEDSATHTGEAGKLAYVNSDGKIHADLAGNADKIAGKPIVTDSLKGGDVLAYDEEDETFVNKPKDYVGPDDVTESGAAGKVVRVAEDGTIHADLTGNASHVGKVKVDAKNWQDGEVLAYHVATGTLQNEARTGVGEAKALILRNNEKVLADYNGTKTVTVNLSTELRQTADTVTNHLERLVGTLYSAVIAAGITPDGYDAMLVENFDDDAPETDRTVARVTSVVSGDDSVDVEDSSGLIIGAYYQLTDGDVQEEVQVKAINISDNINRVILMSPVKNQYHSKRAKFYRSTVAIQNGFAYGGGNTKNYIVTNKAISFQGKDTKVELTKSIDFTDPSAFTIKGAHIKDGQLVMGGAIIGVALNEIGQPQTGFKQINANGDDLKQADL